MTVDIVGDWLQPANSAAWLNDLTPIFGFVGPSGAAIESIFIDDLVPFNGTAGSEDASACEWETARLLAQPTGVFSGTCPTREPSGLVPGSVVSKFRDQFNTVYATGSIQYLAEWFSPTRTGGFSQWEFLFGGAGIDVDLIIDNLSYYANLADSLPSPSPPPGALGWDIEWENTTATYVRTEVQIVARGDSFVQPEFSTNVEWYIQMPHSTASPPTYGFAFGDEGDGSLGVFVTGNQDPNGIGEAADLWLLHNSGNDTDWIVLDENTLSAGRAAQEAVRADTTGLRPDNNSFVPTLTFIAMPTMVRLDDYPGMPTNEEPRPNPGFGFDTQSEAGWGTDGTDFWARTIYTPARMRYVYHVEEPTPDITGELTSVTASFDP